MTLEMDFLGGSRVVGFDGTIHDDSGKIVYLQTDWTFNPNNGNAEVYLYDMKGAKERTFIAGKLRTVTKRQADKKLKWFLD